MIAVLNKRWLTNGWHVMDHKDAEVMALAFIERLDYEQVPYQQYQELYVRAIGLRARRFQQGLKCEDFSVDLMIACWPTLREEIKQREVDSGKFLPENAETVCQFCFGTGFRDHVISGYKVGKKRCDHRE